MRYQRNIPALSEAECALLQGKAVAVIGCGGLGGYLMEYLARIGIGKIRCVDGDVFDETNLNRQLLATTHTIGKPKALEARARLQAINPAITVEPVCAFLTQDNAMELIAGCDIVLDALDNIPARKLLADACAGAGVPYVFGAISGWVAQAAVCMPGENLIEKLYAEDTVIKDKSVLSFTPALCAAMQVSLCIKLLTGRPVESGKLHYADLFFEEYQQIPIK